MSDTIRLTKGAAIISIDDEFAWGYADTPLSNRDRARIAGEKEIVLRLIKLFDDYNTPATWAIVGHLLDQTCSWNKDLPHPEYARPIQKNELRDWFFQHPRKDDGARDICWFDAAHLVSSIRHAKVSHEIASHSYAHIPFDERTTSERVIRTELGEVKRVHRENGLPPPQTFIFPRNKEGFHHLLKDAGFTLMRGLRPRWYSGFPARIRRILHLIDYIIPSAPTSLPSRHSSGLWSIPDSMLLLGRNGMRGMITPRMMVRKACRGIDRAIRRKEIFHLWLHPSNFSYDTETQFRIFEQILAYLSLKRASGALDILTMKDMSAKIKQ